MIKADKEIILWLTLDIMKFYWVKIFLVLGNALLWRRKVTHRWKKFRPVQMRKKAPFDFKCRARRQTSWWYHVYK